MSAQPLGTILRNLRTLSDRHTAARSDAELLARFVAQRDEAAFEVLVWRHGGMVFRLCRRLLGREPDVEDAFQATFLILARDAARIGKRASLAGWLYRVAFRVALRLRARRRTFDPLPDHLVGPAPEPADRLAQREHCGMLLDEIARLPECYRLAVVLCCLEGKTNVQAATELGCPCGTVDSRLAWARRRLRERLMRRGVAPAVAGGLSLSVAWEAQAVPAKLAASTAPLASALVTGGHHALTGAVSTQTLSLLRGVHPMLTVSKLKLAAALMLMAGLIGIGAGGRKNAQVSAQEQPLPRASSGPPHAQEGEWQLQATWKAGNGPVSGLAFAPDGKGLLVSVDSANEKQAGISLREPATGKMIWEWIVNPAVKSVAFSPDGKRLASVEGNGLGVLRDVPTGTQIGVMQGRITVFTFGPSGEIVFGNDTGKLGVSKKGTLPEKFSLSSGPGGPARSVAFSPDGRRIAWVVGETVRLSEGTELKSIWEFNSRTNPSQAAFSPDGKLIAVADAEQVNLLDAASGKSVRVVNVPDAANPVMALSPDGRLVAISGGVDVAVHLIDLATGRIIARLTATNRRVLHLAFSPDARTLAAGDETGTVKVWLKTSRAEVTATPAEDGDRLDRLVAQLAKSGRSNEQCIDALFLTMLGRYPHEIELKRVSERLNKSQDRKESLLDIVWALQNSLEFKAQLEMLQKRRALLAIP